MNYLVKYLFILGLNAFLNLSIANACSCLTDRPFLDVVGYSELVVVVKIDSVVEYTYPVWNGESKIHYYVVDIIKVLKGVESKKQIIIWGEDGATCNGNVPGKIGEIFILALHRGYSFRKKEIMDYAISFCGQHAARVAENKTEFYLGLNASDLMDISKLEEMLLKKKE